MRYHFIGIKGSGIVSLVTIVADREDEVSGSDIEKCIFTQQPLEERHIPVMSFSADNIHEGDTVIIGNALNEFSPEVKKVLAMDTVKIYWYHGFLDSLAREYTSISVAGTRGKTTTTGMLSHVMSLVAPTGYLIGNGTGEMPKDSRYSVLESCECQCHSLTYKLEHIVITSIGLDYVDYYRGAEDYYDAFETFANQIQKGIVLSGGDAVMRSLYVKIEHLCYGLKGHNDVQTMYAKQHEDDMQFDVLYRKELFVHFDLPSVSKPLLWNSPGVIAIGIMEGLSGELLQEGL